MNNGVFRGSLRSANKLLDNCILFYCSIILIWFILAFTSWMVQFQEIYTCRYLGSWVGKVIDRLQTKWWLTNMLIITQDFLEKLVLWPIVLLQQKIIWNYSKFSIEHQFFYICLKRSMHCLKTWSDIRNSADFKNPFSSFFIPWSSVIPQQTHYYMPANHPNIHKIMRAHSGFVSHST